MKEKMAKNVSENKEASICMGKKLFRLGWKLSTIFLILLKIFTRMGLLCGDKHTVGTKTRDQCSHT